MLLRRAQSGAVEPAAEVPEARVAPTERRSAVTLQDAVEQEREEEEKKEEQTLCPWFRPSPAPPLRGPEEEEGSGRQQAVGALGAGPTLVRSGWKQPQVPQVPPPV